MFSDFIIHTIWNVDNTYFFSNYYLSDNGFSEVCSSINLLYIPVYSIYGCKHFIIFPSLVYHSPFDIFIGLDYWKSLYFYNFLDSYFLLEEVKSLYKFYDDYYNKYIRNIYYKRFPTKYKNYSLHSLYYYNPWARLNEIRTVKLFFEEYRLFTREKFYKNYTIALERPRGELCYFMERPRLGVRYSYSFKYRFKNKGLTCFPVINFLPFDVNSYTGCIAYDLPLMTPKTYNYIWWVFALRIHTWRQISYNFINDLSLIVVHYFNYYKIYNNIFYQSWFYLLYKFIVIITVLLVIFFYLYFFKYLYKFIFYCYAIVDDMIYYAFRKFDGLDFEIIHNTHTTKVFKTVTTQFFMERFYVRSRRLGKFRAYDRIFTRVFSHMSRWFGGHFIFLCIYKLYYYFFYGTLNIIFILYYYLYYYFTKSVIGISVYIFIKYYIYLIILIVNIFFTDFFKTLWTNSVTFLNYFVVWYFLNINFTFMRMISDKLPFKPIFFYNVTTYHKYPLAFAPSFHKAFTLGFIPVFDNYKLSFKTSIFFIIINKFLNIIFIFFYNILKFINYYFFSLEYIYLFFFRFWIYIYKNILYFKIDFRFIYLFFFIVLFVFFKVLLFFLMLFIFFFWFCIYFNLGSKKMFYNSFDWIFLVVGLFFDLFITLIYCSIRYSVNFCTFLWRIKKVFIYSFIVYLLYKFGFHADFVIDLLKYFYCEVPYDILCNTLELIKEYSIIDYGTWTDPESPAFESLVQLNLAKFLEFENYLLSLETEYYRFINRWYKLVDPVRPELGYEDKPAYWEIFGMFVNFQCLLYTKFSFYFLGQNMIMNIIYIFIIFLLIMDIFVIFDFLKQVLNHLYLLLFFLSFIL